MWQRLLTVVCGAALVVSWSGCGYSLAGRGTFLPSYIKTVGVPAFQNHTTVFNLETLMTQKVRSEFIGRGKYQILPQDGGVDAVLLGDITTVQIVPATLNAAQLASRYVIVMVANIQFKDLKDNKVLWSNPSVMIREEYDANGASTGIDPNAFFGSETNALDRVTTEFARTIVSSILEAF